MDDLPLSDFRHPFFIEEDREPLAITVTVTELR